MRGVVPRNLSAPDRRSNPVAIASDVKAVLITDTVSTVASARGMRTGPATWTMTSVRVESQEEPDGDHQRQQELLAVAHQEPGLPAGVCQHASRRTRAGGQCRHRSPTRSMTTSSRDRWPTLRSAVRTPCCAHQAAMADSAMGSAAPVTR